MILFGALIVAFGTFWQFQRQVSTAQRSLTTITGGDSFCYLALANPRNPAGTTAVLVHQGRFPLYDVDLDKFAATEAMYRRYAIVSEADHREAAKKRNGRVSGIVTRHALETRSASR